jgi:hypothetical protein
MKNKIQFAFLIGLLLLQLSGCATIYQMDSTQHKVITVSDVISEPAKWQNIFKEIQVGNEVIFHLREGQSIPLIVNLEHPLVTLKAGKNNLVFVRDAYLLISQSKMRISLDGQRWANIGDFKSQKELIGAEKGVFSVGFGATQEEGTQINVNVSVK